MKSKLFIILLFLSFSAFSRQVVVKDRYEFKVPENFEYMDTTQTEEFFNSISRPYDGEIILKSKVNGWMFLLKDREMDAYTFPEGELNQEDLLKKMADNQRSQSIMSGAECSYSAFWHIEPKLTKPITSLAWIASIGASSFDFLGGASCPDSYNFGLLFFGNEMVVEGSLLNSELPYEDVEKLKQILNEIPKTFKWTEGNEYVKPFFWKFPSDLALEETMVGRNAFSGLIPRHPSFWEFLKQNPGRIGMFLSTLALAISALKQHQRNKAQKKGTNVPPQA